MEILTSLLNSDAAVPRLTCYDETTGGRIDLSAQTLDNWASKIANMLHDECDLAPGDHLWIDLPLIWQAACIILGCERAGVTVCDDAPLVVVTTVDRVQQWEDRFPDAYLVAVTDDPFGRGVVECGGEIPPGVIDFGPEVRLHPDSYLGDGPGSDQTPVIGGLSAQQLLAWAESFSEQLELQSGSRVASRGWIEAESSHLTAELWAHNVLSAWSCGGAAVVVRGGDDRRLKDIAAAEKARVI